MVPATEVLRGSREYSISIQTPEQAYREIIETSIATVTEEQDSQTGFFPAATRRFFDEGRHYRDFWVRDNALIVNALLDPNLLALYPPETFVGQQMRTAGVRAIEGMFELFGGEDWQQAFNQEVVIDPNNGVKYLTKSVPRIHTKIDGSSCDWNSQNQPDSFGEFLTVVSSALRSGLISLDEKKQETIESIAKYLTNVIFMPSINMWENDYTDPPATSTVALEAQGLLEIMPYVSDNLQQVIQQKVQAAQEFIRGYFPQEYSDTASWHPNKTNLATLVPLASGALNFLSPFEYLEKADNALGNDQCPGKIRYWDDHYHAEYREALWFMALPLEAIVYMKEALKEFQIGDFQSALNLKKIGEKILQRAMDIKKQYGIYPELQRQIGEGQFALPPNGEINDLLWNHALMIQASALAIQVTKLQDRLTILQDKQLAA